MAQRTSDVPFRTGTVGSKLCERVGKARQAPEDEEGCASEYERPAPEEGVGRKERASR